MSHRSWFALVVIDVDAEVERVQHLGARLQRFVEERGVRFAVLEDPDGNEFCIIPGHRDDAWPAW